jgi:hypothetical protein
MRKRADLGLRAPVRLVARVRRNMLVAAVQILGGHHVSAREDSQEG